MVRRIQQQSKDCESEVPTAAEPASATVSTCSSSENRDAISLNLASDSTSSMTTSFPMTQPESITLDIKRARRPQSDLSQLDCTNDLHLSFLDQIRNPFLARESSLAHSMLKPSRSRTSPYLPVCQEYCYSWQTHRFYAASENTSFEGTQCSLRHKTGYGIAPDG